ncbi:MAG: hypothetical protein OXB88_09595 [Bacteriovoracales bacterium]|nr:hypothetical protein [Bacteriovoracales bacterium]
MEQFLIWGQENVLDIMVVILTLAFIVYFFLDKADSTRLTKRYKSSIFETQSKIFLNATQYLLKGDKDLAIKEFLNAININRETVEAYFALATLFRSNGEIEKSIGIHRSLIARDDISENIRLNALKELAIDFEKGGFLDKALETYKDVLKINHDQVEVIESICHIYERMNDWDQAYHYRMALSKVGHQDQSQTISHILVEKSKNLFDRGDFKKGLEELENAFRFSPSISAKILQLKYSILQGNLDEIKMLFFELLKEHPMFASFVLLSIKDVEIKDKETKEKYEGRLSLLLDYFLKLDDDALLSFPSIILTKIRLFKDMGQSQKAYELLTSWLQSHPQNPSSEALKIEHIKLLIDLKRKDEVLKETKSFLKDIYHDLTRHFCEQCGYNSNELFWRCPQCHAWESIQFRMKI